MNNYEKQILSDLSTALAKTRKRLMIILKHINELPKQNVNDEIFISMTQAYELLTQCQQIFATYKNRTDLTVEIDERKIKDIKG